MHCGPPSIAMPDTSWLCACLLLLSQAVIRFQFVRPNSFRVCLVQQTLCGSQCSVGRLVCLPGSVSWGGWLTSGTHKTSRLVAIPDEMIGLRDGMASTCAYICYTLDPQAHLGPAGQARHDSSDQYRQRKRLNDEARNGERAGCHMNVQHDEFQQ